MLRQLSLLLTTCAFAATIPQWTLPDDVTPLSHTIELTLDPRQPTFTGIARIEVDLKTAHQLIWVNGHELSVKRASVRFADTVQPATIRESAEFIGLELKKKIGPGRAILEIEYSAPLSDTAKSGPYRRQTDGEWYAFTVFTPIDARRAFPCFDEPRFKTVWNMSIRTRAEDRAFSNGPETKTEDQPNDMKLVHFAPTQKIAAEVVAFAVGPWDVYDGGHAGARNTAVRVLTPRGQMERGQLAAEATRHVLPRLEAYTGIPYPWDKLDHVALPQGAFGAVENPGLITYISRGLLLPRDAMPNQVRTLEGLEAHELAHQWFGNLVTQSTWEDVWLSEGFATWFSAEVTDEDEPGARHHLKLEARRARIMDADDGPRSHPVHNPKHTRTEMDSVYDQFPYQKGAAILLTLEGWLGPDHLRDGLRAYLQRYQSGVASSNDLATELSKASGRDVQPVLESLLDHKGVPVVEGVCRNGALRITSDQTVPVCYRTSEGSNCAVAPATVEVKACPAWIEWNTGGMGYFHTRITSLDNVPPLDQLTPPERLTLAFDLKWSISKGAIKLEAADELLKKLEQDSEPEVAAAAKRQ